MQHIGYFTHFTCVQLCLQIQISIDGTESRGFISIRFQTVIFLAYNILRFTYVVLFVLVEFNFEIDEVRHLR